ncbi:terpenoid synthase [Auricularia subglabra TFB-10046 SS5]|uniref:Terpene synthase n=1 Tax=Auricularia subglabra (strain TFB-10046 / SS5) TaxID=717982 RepID=J0DD14_AURST|nr:terpenoid synthase [Auricularia subglabra TFB-10046 SS5]
MPAPIVSALVRNAPDSFVLPDLLTLSSGMQHAVASNPHYDAAAAQSRAWIVSHDVLSERKLAVFGKGDFERLASRAFPYAGPDELRTLCDFVNVLFVIDEATDSQNGVDAQHTADTCMRALEDPSWDDGSALAQIMHEFRARLRPIGGNALRRFIQHFGSYLGYVVEEATNRERGAILGLKEYQALRRENSGCRPYYALIEYALGIDLPEAVYENKHFSRFYWASVDMACYANDVYSYAAEYAQGLDDCNVVTVLMHAKGLSLQATSDYIGAYYEKLLQRYTAAKAALLATSFGDPAVDADVARYAHAMDYWPMGNLVWSFETKRYFGDKHVQVFETLSVPLKHPKPRSP